MGDQNPQSVTNQSIAGAQAKTESQSNVVMSMGPQVVQGDLRESQPNYHSNQQNKLLDYGNVMNQPQQLATNQTIPAVGSTDQQYIQQYAPQQSPSAPSVGPEINQHSTQPHIVAMPSTIKPLLDNDTSTNQPSQSPSVYPTPGSSPQKAIITKVKLSDELNLFDWHKTTDIIHQLAEKAKNSIDSVITTLDPGMKEYLYSGGKVNIMVMSDSDCFIYPIRDAFQQIFGRATVVPARYDSPKTSVDYPIKLASGMDQAVLVAKEKIRALRMDANNVPQNQVIVIVQQSLVCLNNPSPSLQNGQQQDDTSPKWFLTYSMLIEDPVLSLTSYCHSQFIPIDDEIVAKITQDSTYPNDFKDRHLGYTASIDQIMTSRLQIDEQETSRLDGDGWSWIHKWSGSTEVDIIRQLSLSLASAYHREWNDCVQIETMS